MRSLVSRLQGASVQGRYQLSISCQGYSRPAKRTVPWNCQHMLGSHSLLASRWQSSSPRKQKEPKDEQVQENPVSYRSNRGYARWVVLYRARARKRDLSLIGQFYKLDKNLDSTDIDSIRTQSFASFTKFDKLRSQLEIGHPIPEFRAKERCADAEAQGANTKLNLLIERFRNNSQSRDDVSLRRVKLAQAKCAAEIASMEWLSRGDGERVELAHGHDVIRQ